MLPTHVFGPADYAEDTLSGYRAGDIVSELSFSFHCINFAPSQEMKFSTAAGSIIAAATLLSTVNAQYYQRSSACPSLGCVYPPDQVSFIPGQAFDIRVEVQAPLNGSEAYNNGQPNKDFSLTITNQNTGQSSDVETFFNIADPKVEAYNFTYYEGRFLLYLFSALSD